MITDLTGRFAAQQLPVGGEGGRAERALGTPALPANWELLRSKTAGEVGYHLARRGAA